MGYWQQVERFMEMHTDARFTHGPYPECIAKLYGDFLASCPDPAPQDAPPPT